MTGTPNYPPPYGYGLARIKGVAGAFIWLGQALAGRPSRYQHAFLILPSNQVLEAEPNGARITSIDEYWNGTSWDAEFVYPPLTDDQQARLVYWGIQLEGIPYSWIDYISLLLVHLHIRPNWVKHRVAVSRSAICSQLVDEVYASSGVHLFNDGRFPGDVTPADLAYLASQHSDWIWPS